MTEEKSTILAITSRILSYPDESFLGEQPDIENCIREQIQQVERQEYMLEAFKPLYSLSMLDLQELYVSTFDFKDKTSLYVTSHELGDSRKRGTALIDLQLIIQETGYERTDGELADYIPMLLEYLSVAPENEQTIQLGRRVACASHRILGNLASENPYSKVFEILLTYIFGSPTDEDIARFTKDREDADLDPLPYPILYQ